MSKLVSIVLPTYNGEKFIKTSIESVINQTYSNWELIIVNDCSNDSTSEIVQLYANKDSRIKVFTNEKNLKLPASLNVGFSKANGEYYTWTSDDNLYKPNAIEKMVGYLEEHSDIGLVSFAMDWINEAGEVEGEYGSKKNTDRYPVYLAGGCNIGACFMYRADIAKQIGEYDTELFCAEDYDYWCRIALQYNVAYCTENLYQYRRQKQSLSATKQALVIERTAKIHKKYSEAILKKYTSSRKQIAEIYYLKFKKTPSKTLFFKSIKNDFFIVFRFLLWVIRNIGK